MLCPGDASLVRRDPAIPGLETLFDPEAFGELLRRAYPGAAVTEVKPTYVRYKPGTSCLVGYRVRAGAEAFDVYARAHGASGKEKIEKAVRRESVRSPLGDGIKVRADTAIVIYPYPNDHELAALRWLEAPDSRREMLREVLPDQAALWNARLQTLRYKPERRYVGHLDAAGGGAVLKLYTKQDYLVRKENVDTFVSLPPLRVPRRLGRSRRHHLAAIEWLDGIPLAEVMAGTQMPAESCRAVGAALVCLHAQKPKKLQTFWTAEDYARVLVAAAAALVDVAPQVADRGQRLAQKIADKLTTRHWRAKRAIHGDCSADQVLIADGMVGIVDFDRAGYGDPRIDLASFRARLIFDVLCGRLAEDRANECFDHLLDEYRRESAKDITRKLDRFTAACLLQFAVEPFRLRLPDWPQKLEAIVARAEALATGATAT